MKNAIPIFPEKYQVTPFYGIWSIFAVVTIITTGGLEQ